MATFNIDILFGMSYELNEAEKNIKKKMQSIQQQIDGIVARALKTVGDSASFADKRLVVRNALVGEFESRAPDVVANWDKPEFALDRAAHERQYDRRTDEFLHRFGIITSLPPTQQ